MNYNFKKGVIKDGVLIWNSGRAMATLVSWRERQASRFLHIEYQ